VSTVSLPLPRALPQERLEDDEDLRQAYSRYAGELFGLARRTLDDPGLAEEAVQETFLRAWRAAHRFDPGLGSLRTWLFAICRNIIVDLSRARAARPRVVEGEPLDHPAPVDDLDQVLTSTGLEAALQQISERHRVVLIEVHLNGRPIADVATELGVPPGTIYSRLYYGLKALGVVLEEAGWLS
jgi:RNA polymerase sigma-70 factor, ECF subfamily